MNGHNMEKDIGRKQKIPYSRQTYKTERGPDIFRNTPIGRLRSGYHTEETT